MSKRTTKENVLEIAKSTIPKLAIRGEVKRIIYLVYDETATILKASLNIVRDPVDYTEHTKRKTVTALDVIYELKRQRKTLYGFGG